MKLMRSTTIQQQQQHQEQQINKKEETDARIVSKNLLCNFTCVLF